MSRKAARQPHSWRPSPRGGEGAGVRGSAPRGAYKSIIAIKRNHWNDTSHLRQFIHGSTLEFSACSRAKPRIPCPCSPRGEGRFLQGSLFYAAWHRSPPPPSQRNQCGAALWTRPRSADSGTFRSADAVGYRRLMGAAEAATLVRPQGLSRGLRRRCSSSIACRIAGTAGDSMLAEFASVVRAVECAVAMQSRDRRAQRVAAAGAADRISASTSSRQRAWLRRHRFSRRLRKSGSPPPDHRTTASNGRDQTPTSNAPVAS